MLLQVEIFEDKGAYYKPIKRFCAKWPNDADVNLENIGRDFAECFETILARALAPQDAVKNGGLDKKKAALDEWLMGEIRGCPLDDVLAASDILEYIQAEFQPAEVFSEDQMQDALGRALEEGSFDPASREYVNPHL